MSSLNLKHTYFDFGVPNSQNKQNVDENEQKLF